MARVHTHYDNLKVARNAPPEVIRAAYKTLSKKYHPDLNPNNPDAMRIIQLINAAYDVLSDPVKRQEHDRWIAQEEAGDTAHAGRRETGAPDFHATPSAWRSGSRSKSRHGRSRRSSSPRLLHKLQALFSSFSRYLSKRA